MPPEPLGPSLELAQRLCPQPHPCRITHLLSVVLKKAVRSALIWHRRAWKLATVQNHKMKMKGIVGEMRLRRYTKNSWHIKKKEQESGKSNSTVFSVLNDKEMCKPCSKCNHLPPCGITYMWNLKYDTNELIYKTEAGSRQRTDFLLPERRGVRGCSESLGLAHASHYI